jgi:hypothetical protein
MHAVARRGLAAVEIEFCRENPESPECARLLSAWAAARAMTGDPGALEEAVAAFRAAFGQPVVRAREFWAYTAVVGNGREDVAMVRGKHGTTALAACDPMALLGLGPLVAAVRGRGTALTLRAYAQDGEGDGLVDGARREDGAGPPRHLYAFLRCHPDGHEATMTFADADGEQPMLSSDPRFAATMRDALAERLRSAGQDVILRRYTLAGEADEREVLARCA